MQESGGTNENAAAQVVDIRGMQSPDNVLLVLKRASELPKGAALELRADCNPFQLYDLLQQRGFVLKMERLKDGSYLGKLIPRGN
jgi:uncharacterized protein (DUF2249 family)